MQKALAPPGGWAELKQSDLAPAATSGVNGES
jgi:hypothetical protein